MDAKSRPTFREIVQQLEEALTFPPTKPSNSLNLFTESWRCPVVATRSNPCSKVIVEARSEEFLLKSDRPEENNQTKCNIKLRTSLFLHYSIILKYVVHRISVPLAVKIFSI